MADYSEEEFREFKNKHDVRVYLPIRENDDGYQLYIEITSGTINSGTMLAIRKYASSVEYAKLMPVMNLAGEMGLVNGYKALGLSYAEYKAIIGDENEPSDPPA